MELTNHIDETDLINTYVLGVIDRMAYDISYSENEIRRACRSLAASSRKRGTALPLQDAAVFSPASITAFVRDHLAAYPAATRSNYRAIVRRVAEALQHREEDIKLASSNPVEPYCGGDVKRLKAWARSLSGAKRDDANLILALGLGAGLKASEITGLKRGNVRIDETGVHIAINAERPRTVTVLREYEADVDKAWRRVVEDDKFLVNPNRKADGTGKNYFNNLVRRGLDCKLNLNSQRLRATWLIHHLDRSTPLTALVAAAGLEGLDGLTRYLPFVADHIEANRAQLLRR